MHYSTDRPINSIDEDLLGRASFSQQVGRAIYGYKGKDSLVIGLFGKWGIGKTSVANMALQTVEELSKDDEKPPVIIRFTPWNYSDKDNLIAQFFSSLKTSIDLEKNDELKNKVGKALSDYSGVFEFASLIPIVGGPIATFLKEIVKTGGEELSKPKDLNISKNELEKALLEVDQKIVVLIDDIDRLTNSQIRDIFQLVKQVGDFPNITYILVMDREVVIRALSEFHNFDGNEYLEKIIQIPFEIPELRKSKLHDIFISELKKVIEELSNNIVWDQQYFDRVFSYCIDPYLLTLRDVNRVINTFQFRYSMLFEETSLEDMLSITTLEVLRPDLYKWIAENKDSVCGGLMHGFFLDRNKPEENKKRYEAVFQTLGLDASQSIMSVAAMFPAFAKDVGVHFNEIGNQVNIRMQMRAAEAERFELYFMFDMEDIKVPRSIINSCIYTLDKEDLKKTISEINEQGNISFFIDEIRSMIDQIPYNRLSLLASVFMDIQYGFKGDAFNTIITISAIRMAGFLTKELIRKLKTNDERFELYKDSLLKANSDSIDTVAYELRKLERAYGRYDDNEEKEEQLVSVEQLSCLEKLFMDRIKVFSESDALLEAEESTQAFILWEEIDKESAQEYLNEVFKDDIKALKYICKFTGKWSGSNGSGWSFAHSNYSEYISEDEIYELIQRFDKGQLSKFTELEKLKLASFILNYKKDEFMYATEEEARQLVKQWNNV